jgi:putative iron-dependent peroxidase
MVENPSTQHALWLWLLGDDRGELLHRSQAIEAALAPALSVLQVTEGFRYNTDRDLTGYEDGTENPVDDAAVEAAIVANAGAGLDGGCFVAVQQWQHDLNGFAARPQTEQDNLIGRRKSDNEELEDAPLSAHVKRTAQESFSPEAFTVRRSMPWTENGKAGLMFVSFSRTLNAFEVQLRRMSGMEDGIVDGLYSFSRPLSGGYYWCPPLKDGRLDLSAVRPA